MKNLLFVLPLVLLLSSFKPANHSAKHFEGRPFRTSGQPAKQQTINYVNIIPNNPQELFGIRVKFVNILTSQVFIFDIPQIVSQQPVLGQVPTGSYDVYFYPVIPNSYTYNYEVGDYGPYGYLGASGQSVVIENILVENDNIVSVTK